MADTKLNVLGLCGSLRKGSYNRMALRAAMELAPPGMSIDTIEIGAIPLFNQDIEDQGFPAPVQALSAKIAAVDAVLFVTPEYNYSVPGVLKNAIDWVSRAPKQPFDGKPVAIMGASQGNIGTARAQYHLRQTCVFLNAFPLNRPEVMIGRAQEKFDKDGRLTDEATRKFIGKLLVALAEWTQRLRPPS
jgi:chromate reductase, NAD(P)H dehydrogenase (quinone)